MRADASAFRQGPQTAPFALMKANTKRYLVEGWIERDMKNHQSRWYSHGQ